MRNLRHVVKQDEVDKIISFTLEDESGEANLTTPVSFTVTMNLSRGGELVIEDAAVTKRNQTTNTGECYHTWTADTIPDAPGIYKGELKLVSGGTTLYWPVNANNDRTYFTVEVQEPLS